MSFLPAFLFLTTPVIYYLLEAHTARATTQPYSYTRHFTSALAYPYSYRDRDTNILTQSPRAFLMKGNFILNGLLYLYAQLLFIERTGQGTSRIVAAWLYAIGIILVALDSGNTGRSNGEKRFQLHGLGAFLAIVCGNVGSVLVGIATNGVYRLFSLGLGVGGLIGMGIWAREREGKFRGLWQRSSIYPIQIWMAVTGVLLARKGL